MKETLNSCSYFLQQLFLFFSYGCSMRRKTQCYNNKINNKFDFQCQRRLNLSFSVKLCHKTHITIKEVMRWDVLESFNNFFFYVIIREFFVLPYLKMSFCE